MTQDNAAVESKSYRQMHIDKQRSFWENVDDTKL